MNLTQHSKEYGPSTSLLKGFDGESEFYLSTAKGYVLKYSITENYEPSLLLTHKITNKSIRTMVLIERDDLLISNSKGTLYRLKGDKLVKLSILLELKTPEPLKKSKKNKAEVEKEDKADEEAVVVPDSIGITNAITSNGPSCIFIGNDDGDIFSCSLERENTLLVKGFYSHHSDLISGLLLIPNKKTLLSSSGDGMLSVIDLKKEKVVAESKNFEEEITHLSSLSSLFCVSTGGGSFKFFKWNYWGAPCDSLKEIEHDMAAINTFDVLGNVIVSGCEEGIIRLVRVLPEKPGSCAAMEVLSVENESIERLICLKDGIIVFITCDEYAVRSHHIGDDKITSLMEIEVKKKSSNRKVKKYSSSDDDDDENENDKAEKISKSESFFGELD